MKKLIPVLALVASALVTVACLATPPASATNRYIAQSAGVFSGGSACKGQTAITPSTFNGIRNVPGDVNYICGTITGDPGSQLLKPKGNGAAGNPVTIKFDTGAILQAPYFAPSPNGGCGGAICLYGLSYYTVDGQHTGTIQNTANGSGLEYQQNSEGIEAYNCDHCAVENLTIANIYVHSSPSDRGIDNSQVRCLSISGSNWLISGNTFHDAGFCINNDYRNGDANVEIKGNILYNIDHGWTLQTHTAGGSSGPFLFHHNTVYGYANWDTPTDTYHHDGIHCYTSETKGAPAHITLLAIYDNHFNGPIGKNATSHVFIEGGTGSGSTPCADASSGIAVFNNVAEGDQPDPDGLFGLFSGNYTPAHGGGVYNNTLISTAGTYVGVCFSANSDVSGMSFQNNAVSGCNQLMETHGVPFTPDYNQYGNGGGNAFVCHGNFYSESQLSSWQSCIKGDSHSSYRSALKLGSRNEPLSGSPLINKGTNLSSLCTGVLVSLCSDYSGTARPATGAWTAGAYAASGARHP